MELWCDNFNENFASIAEQACGAPGLQCKMFIEAVGNPMRNVDEYRRSAASMLDLAQRADSVADKNRLLVMAEAWLDLAARAAKPTAADHPPVRMTLGSVEAE
jgi:hypothetical protein